MTWCSLVGDYQNSGETCCRQHSIVT